MTIYGLYPYSLLPSTLPLYILAWHALHQSCKVVPSKNTEGGKNPYHSTPLQGERDTLNYVLDPLTHLIWHYR